MPSTTPRVEGVSGNLIRNWQQKMFILGNLLLQRKQVMREMRDKREEENTTIQSHLQRDQSRCIMYSLLGAFPSHVLMTKSQQVACCGIFTLFLKI